MVATRAPYILLGGVLESEDRIRLDHVLPVDRSPQWPVGEGEARNPTLVVQFFGVQGPALLRHPIEMQPLCLLPPRGAVEQGRQWDVAIGGIVPLPQGACLLEIVRGSDVLAARQIPEQGPEVTLDWSSDDLPRQGAVTIRWSAHHPDGAAMLHTLCVVHEDGRWQELTLPGKETEANLDVDSLPGGLVAIGVHTTDGFHVSHAVSSVMARPLGRCRPVILSPRPGQRASSTDQILLLGCAHYRESGEPEEEWLSWSSNIDGELGRRASQTVQLSEGTHLLTLRAGVPGREGEAHVEMCVGHDLEASAPGQPDGRTSRPDAGTRTALPGNRTCMIYGLVAGLLIVLVALLLILRVS